MITVARHIPQQEEGGDTANIDTGSEERIYASDDEGGTEGDIEPSDKTNLGAHRDKTHARSRQTATGG